MAEDRDVYEGEYTLDDGDVVDDEEDDGRGGRGRSGGNGDLDLDAGMVTMD